MIEIRAGSVAEMEMEAEELLKQHYEELTLNKEFVKLEVDWDKYYALEKQHMLASLVAREGSVLVGYAAFFIFQHPHYKSLKVASNDVLYLHKDYRNGTTAGLRLIKESEKHLRSIGVNKITWHVKRSNDFSPILARMGYDNEEIIMGKILEV